MREYHVYIMTNGTGSTLYTGVTNDIERRVSEHKKGTGRGSFTSRYKMTRLVYCESAGKDVYAAIQREKQIKGWVRQRKIDLIKSQNPRWEDLSVDGDAPPLVPPALASERTVSAG